MKKKIITLVIAFLIMFHIFSLTACDKSEGVWGYRLLDDETIAITKINDLDAVLDERGFLTIPTELEITEKNASERKVRVSQVGYARKVIYSHTGIPQMIPFHTGNTPIERIIIPKGVHFFKGLWYELNANSVEFLFNDITWGDVINGILGEMRVKYNSPLIVVPITIIVPDGGKAAFFEELHSRSSQSNIELVLERLIVLDKSETE